MRWDNKIRSTGDLTIEHLREALRMGYYIEVPTHHDKAEMIESMYEGMIIPQPTSFDKVPKEMALICVVDNVLFEAAGFCYDEREFQDFTDPKDGRSRKFLLMSWDLASELSGHKKVMEGRK